MPFLPCALWPLFNIQCGRTINMILGDERHQVLSWVWATLNPTGWKEKVEGNFQESQTLSEWREEVSKWSWGKKGKAELKNCVQSLNYVILMMFYWRPQTLRPWFRRHMWHCSNMLHCYLPTCPLVPGFGLLYNHGEFLNQWGGYSGRLGSQPSTARTSTDVSNIFLSETAGPRSYFLLPWRYKHI